MKDLSVINDKHIFQLFTIYGDKHGLFTEFNEQKIIHFNSNYSLKYITTVITKELIKRGDKLTHQFNYTNNIHELFNNDLNVLIEL